MAAEADIVSAKRSRLGLRCEIDPTNNCTIADLHPATYGHAPNGGDLGENMIVESSEHRTAEYSVGVDVGGTHTDLILASSRGLVRSKAFTTHAEYSEGIFNALDLAVERAGSTRQQVLANCRAFINGSTIVTNAITELRGAKVGVLITRGFKDTFRLANSARTEDHDDQLQVPPPTVVDRDCIVEITERTVRDGKVLVSVSDDEVRLAARSLKDRGVETIAVCYLWSFVNPTNEDRTHEILGAEFPEMFLTLSSRVHPVMGEYPRFMTAVFNCLSHRATTRYVDGLRDRLAGEGFVGNLSFFQGVGGSAAAEAVKATPVTLMQSGPAGGVMGARYVAERLGYRNILIGDMGGTSFDTAVLPDLEVTISKKTNFGPLKTGINTVDIISVGAGGGSVAWLDSRGVPQVGPRSAGSEPGPACYGRGGTEPTVTDANVVLGLIDPTNYLGGRYAIDADAAAGAIDKHIAQALGWSTREAAAGVYDLAVVEMANALREVSIERGHDPREFTFFSYGGGLGLFAVEVCRRLDISQIVVPDNSSAFSAFGVLIADYVRQYERTVGWDLSVPTNFEHVNRIVAEMLAEAVTDAENEGIPADTVKFERSGAFRFVGQTYEVSIPLESRDFCLSDAAKMAETFPTYYERNYGEGTAWKGSPVQLLNVAIRAISAREKPVQRRIAKAPSRRAVARNHRSVYLPVERTDESIPVFVDVDLIPGTVIEGPGIIDVGDTTVYLPDGSVARRDESLNFIIAI